MAVILGHLSRQLSVVDLKIPEIVITEKTRRYKLFMRGIYINLVFSAYLV